ncbi:MAG: TonB-dependent receptor [Vicingaceae bacterium]
MQYFKLRTVLILTAALLCTDLWCQSEFIVSDQEGKALIGAHITFSRLDQKGKSLTVLTNAEGKATIPAAYKDQSEPFLLSISYLGFKPIIDTLSSPSTRSYSLQEDDIALDGLVVTGEYTPQNPEKSDHKIKVINSSEIESMGAVNLNDALQFQTNLRLSQDNILGSSVNVQGISGENVKILLDGVPMIGRQDGNLDLNQINLNNIERIEIVEGPLSVNYGTNALAGTINLITKKDQKESITVGAKTYYESVGQYNADAQTSFKTGRHRISIAGGRNFFRGFTPGQDYSFLPESRPADTSRTDQWRPKEQYFFDVQYQIALGDWNVRLFSNFFNEEIISRGLPRAPYYESAFDQYFNTIRLSQGAEVGANISEGLKIKFLASHSDFSRIKSTMLKNLTNLEEISSANPQDHDTSRFESWMSRSSIILGKPQSRMVGEVGYDVFSELATGKRIEGGGVTMLDYALFGSLKINLSEHWILKPGIRISENSIYRAPPVPGLNVKYQSGRFTLRSSYAQGFRSPSLKELYFEFVDVNHNITGNPDLKAETSHNVQLDATYSIYKGQTLTRIEGGYFINDITDLITLAQQGSATTFSYINVGSFQTQGFKAGLHHRRNHWRTTLNFLYTGRSNSISDSVQLPGMTYSPELSADVRYEFKKLEGNIGLFYKYTGSLPSFSIDESGEVNQLKVQDYQMANVTASKYLWKRKITLTIGVKNLFDVQNLQNAANSAVHGGSGNNLPISWGRSYFFTFKLFMGWT